MPKPTTLVLGAGSSCDYGYPSGRELCKRILNLSPESFDKFQGPFPPWDAKSFLKNFRQSNFRSIDAFLAKRPQFGDIGKIAISRILFECEHQFITRAISPQDDWQGYLIDRFMREEWGGFDLSWLTFITFNYDRHLEYMLLSSLESIYGENAKDTFEKFKKINILHVYGSLGDSFQGNPQHPYGSCKENNYRLQQMCTHAAHNIKIIREGTDDDQSLEKIRQVLNESERICFLGFSFDETNVRRLGAPNAFIRGRMLKDIAAATYGMERSEVQAAFNLLIKGANNFIGMGIPTEFINTGCESLLRKTLWLG